MSLYNYAVANTNNTQSRTGNRVSEWSAVTWLSPHPGERRGISLTAGHRGPHARPGLSALTPRPPWAELRAFSACPELSVGVQGCSSPGLGTVGGGDS